MTKQIKSSYCFSSNSKKENIRCCFVVSNNFGNDVVHNNNYHFHSMYEIHIPIKHEFSIITDNTELALKPEEVCVIPPNSIHCINDSNIPRAGLRFSFSKGNNLFENVYGQLKVPTVIKAKNIYEKYISLACKYNDAGVSDFMVSDVLFHALYEIAFNFSEKKSSIAQKKIPLASDTLDSEKIENFLNLNYGDKIHLKDLAQYLNLSERQTQRIIKKLFDVTFASLLNKRRLIIAGFLLKTTDMSIDEISHISGFEDKSYFYRKFKGFFNTSPALYRTKMHKAL